ARGLGRLAGRAMSGGGGGWENHSPGSDPADDETSTDSLHAAGRAGRGTYRSSHHGEGDEEEGRGQEAGGEEGRGQEAGRQEGRQEAGRQEEGRRQAEGGGVGEQDDQEEAGRRPRGPGPRARPGAGARPGLPLAAPTEIAQPDTRR